MRQPVERGNTLKTIDADALRVAMYEEAFVKDSPDQRWDSGCWIRYRLFERILDKQPAVSPDSQWVYCEDQLPEKNEWVLVTDIGTDSIDIMRRVDVDLKGMIYTWEDSHGNFISDVDAIAWMPLPQLAKKKEGNTEK